MFNKIKSNTLVLFVVAWVLTLNGSNILLGWLVELIVALEVDPQTALLPIIGRSLQIILNLIAAGLAYLATSEKSLRPMAIVAVTINVITVVSLLATFLYAVLSGKIAL
jgi:hypothetical protein